MTTTFERLCALLIRDYKLAPELLTPEAQFEALGLDSLGVAELLFNVEDEFRIVLPPEPLKLPDNLGGVARLIEELIAKRGAAAAVAASPAGTPPASNSSA